MRSLVSKIADFSHIINAQLRLRGKARAPFSVRLQGRVQLSGCGEVVFGEGVSLVGTVVPVELVTYASGRIEIGDHTFINYGSSIAARASVKIGSHCHLGHYTFVMDNDQQGRPAAHPVEVSQTILLFRCHTHSCPPFRSGNAGAGLRRWCCRGGRRNGWWKECP